MGGAGAFGFVQLAKNKVNEQLVAIKFLERGPDKVCTRHLEFVVEKWPIVESPLLAECLWTTGFMVLVACSKPKTHLG